jgi:hypothetical protein
VAKSGFGFFKNIFKLRFIHSIHLLVNDPLGKVFKHLQNLFDPKDLINNLSQLFQICSYVVSRHIAKSIAKAFNVMKLLAFVKISNGIRSIAISEVLY